ncbi:MAG: SDR family NAD(P)-dependent oxidoreductase [Chloroflexi bacterium]|nr:SDR family NAD(P)-dependent oxidoreductase [Chloroflexota bacterium]
MERAVIVTGAAGWLGGAIARAFGKAGDKVMLSDINTAPLGELAAAVNKGPGQALTCGADTRNYDEVKALVEETIKRWQRVDVMACVAGAGLTRLSGRQHKLLIECTDEEWDLVVDSNLKGTFHSIKAVAEPMMRQKDGHIIIMGSGTGSRGNKRRSAYASAKAGVYGLMKCAALELGGHNIRVNVVNPGRNLRPGEAIETEIVEQNILKRTNDPAEVAAFYVHLSGMHNVSGQIFNLDSRILF